MPSPRNLLVAAAVLGGLTPAWSHGEEGAAGRPAHDTGGRVVRVSIVERPDGAMVFEPAAIRVRAGDDIRFEIRNDGKARHEFRIDSVANNRAHKAMMAAMPGMQHREANSVSIAPGATGRLAWRFTRAGTFEIACLIPGHYEAGMHAVVTVAR